MRSHYVLRGHDAVPANLLTWGKEFEKSDRTVNRSQIGDVLVSTVFLGLDHQFGDGPPLLFETMVFGGTLDQETDRYSTWEEAESGHSKMVARVKGLLS